MTAPDATAHALARVEGPGARALALLADPGAPPLEAVTWASAHLSAFQHAVLPVLGRLDDPSVGAALRASATRAAASLRLLEQSLSGDALVPSLDRVRARADLVRLLDARQTEEEHVLLRLAAGLTLDELARLADRYDRALEHAPTRPHPHTPGGALVERVAFGVNGWRDRVMDSVDARHVPSPRPVIPAPVSSRWGDYLLGQGSPRPPD